MTGQAGEQRAELGGVPTPLHLVFMGVSGSGKSAAGRAVQERLGWEMAEGDDFHPPENVEKMEAGIPLTDDDRWAWLETLAEWTAERDRLGQPTLLSCSALRRPYRDVLRKGGAGTFFVHMTGNKHMILERMQSRTHFMPSSLLESQLDTLQQLGADEPGMVVDAVHPLGRIASMVLARLDLI